MKSCVTEVEVLPVSACRGTGDARGLIKDNSQGRNDAENMAGEAASGKLFQSQGLGKCFPLSGRDEACLKGDRTRQLSMFLNVQPTFLQRSHSNCIPAAKDKAGWGLGWIFSRRSECRGGRE